MKYIHILRHADAAWGAKGSKDINRPLSPAGHEQCHQLAGYIKKKAIKPDLVLCSPALRVKETCDDVKQALGAEWSIVDNDLLYLCDSNQLLEEIQMQDDVLDRLLIIGHNPTFQEISWLFSQRCNRQTLENIESSFPPACLVSLSFECNSWSDVDKGKGQITDIFKPE